MSISTSDVTQVYSGKPGCSCGCRGKYTEASDASPSARALVTKVVRMLNESPRTRRNDGDALSGGPILYLDTDRRTYAVYLKPGTNVSWTSG